MSFLLSHLRASRIIRPFLVREAWLGSSTLHHRKFKGAGLVKLTQCKILGRLLKYSLSPAADSGNA